ncbi:inner membrane protein YhjD [Smaragdicoccus niigatensis]|uniref:inner membrane protein YhjD n=2 Tax=Smaragdicoccus niigatensis TaxID=359359 RepID=UPI000369E622|nr:inner membrane protein YhjD [Smaragdicoccus niigatensis]
MKLKERFEEERLQRPWLDHLITAAMQYQSQRGDFFAAAVTYFTVLAIFPLLMISFSIAGFVLVTHPELLSTAQAKISNAAPGAMGDQLKTIIDQAINSRSTVGAIGLLGALYAGLGWMANFRAALTEQWLQNPPKMSFIKAKLGDLVALLGLLSTLIFSVAITAVTSGSLAEKALSLVGLEHSIVAAVLIKVVGILIGVLASWLLFVYIVARLPYEPVTLRSAARAALIAAVVFEIFKQIATLYLRSVLHSPAGAVFGPIIGIMVFAFFTYRIALFATAWAATAPENVALATVAPPGTAVIEPRIQVRRGMGVIEATAVVGAGVLVAFGLGGVLGRKKA